MSREALLDLLRERIGLDPATLGERVIDDACAEARRRLGVADDLALHARVVGDGQAWTACVEAFTVPESWFFRAGEQFADLARHARALPARPYRVLCLPSAAGEEAWSAAISLLDAGLAPGEFEVLGIDVSPAAIAKAGAGLYRRSVFRGQTPPATWLHPAGEGGYRVDPLLRRCVRFRTGNALDPRLLADEAPFAAVFCRNLLIYLHADARRRVLLALLSRLRPDGLLFAGQAEVLSSFDQRLQPWPGGSPLTFVTATGSRAAGETPASRRES
ncbi:CheR family methyltransferase, partial [Arenimonas composti]